MSSLTILEHTSDIVILTLCNTSSIHSQLKCIECEGFWTMITLSTSRHNNIVPIENVDESRVVDIDMKILSSDIMDEIWFGAKLAIDPKPEPLLSLITRLFNPNQPWKFLMVEV